ncbi:MAG: hypothetical protein K0R00_187 [Herbinix sp.]|nr:hypothetical protein [Herbinix sp.]
MQMVPPGYTDVVWPETTASVVLEETDKKFMTAADKSKLDGVAANANNYAHPTGLVTPGTYRSLTVNTNGHVTSGTNPTTLLGYGITDAAPSSHVGSTGTAHGVATSSVNGFMTAADKSKLDGVAANANNYAHPTGLVTPGTYKSVTVNTNGHVTAGANPTTLSEYGITDAAPSSHVGSTGAAHGVATSSVNGFMTAADKSKLDGVAANANNYSHPTGVATPGTYKSVTVNTNGHVTAGTNPTTLSGYGITDAASMLTVSATLPATIGWYRIATSTAGILRCVGQFDIDWTLLDNYGAISLNAGIMYGADPTLDQEHYIHYDANGLTKARLVYHTTASGNYAYLEVYNKSAAALTVTVRGLNLLGWSLIVPGTTGSIPTGYSNYEITFTDGIFTNNVIKSSLETGVSPFEIASSTMVSNLNANYVGGKTVSELAPSSHVGSTGTAHGVATSSVNGFMTATDKSKLDGVAANANNYSHPTGVATPGTYKSVTVNTNGHVTAGTNPTTLSEYGITDATPSSHVGSTGTAHGVVTTSVNGFMTAADKSKLDGVAANANNYAHPTTSGNKHIPSGGASGQVLKYSADGTAVWGTDNDTITTINGKTGAITKADITALGIPAQDTVYTHPGTHPYSMITGTPTSLPANGGNADYATMSGTVGGYTLNKDIVAPTTLANNAVWLMYE